MIVKQILTNPELIWSFDFFNDAKDTINWLETIQTPKAQALITQIEFKIQKKELNDIQTMEK